MADTPTAAPDAAVQPPARLLPLTSGALLRLAVPVMISNATTPLVGLVDTAVIGQLGAAHLLGGVAVAATIFNLMFGACYFLQLGTIGFTAQATGAGDRSEIAANLHRSLLAALAIGLLIVILRQPIAAFAVDMVGGSAAVRSTAAEFFAVRSWSVPAALMQMAVIGWLIGLGRTPVVFGLQLLLNVVNVLLALAFVVGLGWGVRGAALATATAEWTAATAGLAYAAALLIGNRWTASLETVLRPQRIAAALANGRDIMIRTLCITGAFSLFVARGAASGDVTLAANAALFQLAMVTVYLIDGFETAAQTLVGQAVGARDRARYRLAVRLSFVWAGATGVIMALVLWTAGPGLIALLSSGDDVRAAAGHYLVWATLIPVLGLWAFIFDGIFVGATRGVDLRNMMLVSLAAYLLAIVTLSRMFGNDGLWAALLVFFVVRALTLWACLSALERDAFSKPVAA